MKIEFCLFQRVSHNIKKSKATKEGIDFATALQKAYKSLRPDEVEPSSGMSSLGEKAIKLAEEIVETLHRISEFDGASPQRLAQEIEDRVEALRGEVGLFSGSGKRLLEEVMLLGAVEAQKLRRGFYP